MNKEAFKNFLMESYSAKEVDNLITSAERLESIYNDTLESISSTEENSQKLRMSIYLDYSLTPSDKKRFPDVIKLYYQFTNSKLLPPLDFKTKGQRNK